LGLVAVVTAREFDERFEDEPVTLPARAWRYFADEREFTRWVLDSARTRGWLAAHLGNVQIRRGKGGVPIAVPDKDAAGFPDLVLVHTSYGIVWAELKMPLPSGRVAELDDEQVIWLRALRATGATVYVWSTRDQHEILDVLNAGELAGEAHRLFGSEIA
jgi:hypothetical protein